MFDLHLAEIDGKRIDFDLTFLENEYPHYVLSNQDFDSYDFPESMSVDLLRM